MFSLILILIVSFVFPLFLWWGDQHAIAYVEGDKYYGAKATINVWEPKYSSQTSSVCLSFGYWEVPLVKTLTALKLVGRYSYGLLLITQFQILLTPLLFSNYD